MSLTLLLISTSFGQKTSSVEIYPLDSKPFGLSYEDYVKNYWKLMLRIPEAQNPMNDAAGVLCTYEQDISNSSIFYLPTNLGGKSPDRTCKIPEGLSIFIPIMMVESSTKEMGNVTISELHQNSKDDQDKVNSLSLTVDSTKLNYEDLKKYRTHTKDFQVNFPDKGLFGVINGGPATVVADGYHVLIKPLSKGTHVIHTSGVLPCLETECKEPNFITDVNTTLIVE
jgi:hypothetical protein